MGVEGLGFSVMLLLKVLGLQELSKSEKWCRSLANESLASQCCLEKQCILV